MRCPRCQKKVATVMLFSCKFCSHEYCAACQLPETHACPGLFTCVRMEKTRLETKLVRESTGSSHNLKPM